MQRPPQPDPALPPEQVLALLDDGPRRLLAAVQQLYRGSHDDCAEDIRRRSAGRPYLYRLDLQGLHSPEEALVWLRGFAAYEAARGEVLPAIPLPR